MPHHTQDNDTMNLAFSKINVQKIFSIKGRLTCYILKHFVDAKTLQNFQFQELAAF